jgi:prevent-host-death family protein
MSSIGVRELRQNASRWLERVRGGEAFDITVQGRPVARLVPWKGQGGLASLIEEGVARPGSTSLQQRLAELGPPPSEGPSASKELERLRADER